MDFVYYPDLDDPDFYQTIYNKEEFYSTKQLKLVVSPEQICNPSYFVLQPHQIFLHNYMSPETPYTGILIIHGTGAGKTCSAITIAEGYKPLLELYNKKVYIIASQHLQENFQKEIYNVESERREEVPGNRQCTGTNYYISPSEEPDPDKRHKLIKQKIKDYYNFFGIQSFVRYVDYKVKTEHRSVGEVFSNAIIIIDEAHSITGENKFKEEKTPDARGILDVLHEIIEESENLKLVLLTATPMKDSPAEIVHLVNLLRHNDGREQLDPKRLFRTEGGEIIDIDTDYLHQGIRGYISYYKGHNPLSFPKVLYPKEAIVQEPVYDIFEEPIDYSAADIKRTRTIPCPMSYFQFHNINVILRTHSKSKDIYSRQAANIIFPSGKFGIAGFTQTFKEISPSSKSNSSHKLYKYLKHAEGFLHIDRIQKYSSKFWQFLQNIIKAPGICYVNTDFLEAGAITLALLLEENGYQRYRLPYINYDNSLLAKSGHRPMRCAICGQFDIMHRSGKIDDHKFIQAKYILFTGNPTISPIRNITEELKVINSVENKYGHLIKIVIGTRVSSQGIDYKRIRQVHAIDAWHNDTRLKQVEGRAVRHCSHIDLPESERNVTVFKYAISAPKVKIPSHLRTRDDHMQPLTAADKSRLGIPPQYNLRWIDFLKETPDERIYLRIDKKNIVINRILSVLKNGAVDCAINYTFNSAFDDENIVCQEVNLAKTKINRDTSDAMYFSEPYINYAKQLIISFFRYEFVYDLDSIIYLIKQFNSVITKKIIYEALGKIVGAPPFIEPVTLYDRFNREGHIIVRGNLYIFQPNNLPDDIPLWYKKTPIELKPKYIAFDSIVNEFESKRPAQRSTIRFDTIMNQLLLLQAISDIEVLYEFDRLPFEQQNRIYQSPKLDRRLVNILNYYFYKMDRLFGVSTFDFNRQTTYDIYRIEFEDGPKYYSKKGDQWTTIDRNSNLIIDLESSKNAQDAIKIQTNDVYGFLDRTGKEPVFKIIDKRKEVLKNRLNKNYVQKRSQLRGRICRNGFEVTQLKKYLDEYNIKVPEGKRKMSRNNICRYIELKLRELEYAVDRAISEERSEAKASEERSEAGASEERSEAKASGRTGTDTTAKHFFIYKYYNVVSK